MAASHWIDALDERPSLAYESGSRLIWTGIAFVLLGIAAIAEPLIGGLALTLFVALLLLGAAATHVFSAFADGVGHAIWHASVGLIYAAAALYFLFNPLMGLAVFTLMLAGVLVVEVALDVFAYIWQQEQYGSGWLLLKALVTMMVASMIWLGWPATSVWTVGTLLGINLLTAGVARFMYGAAIRRAVRLMA